MIGRIDLRLEDKDTYAAVWAVMQATSPQGSMLFLDNVFVKWLQYRAASRFSNEGDDVVGAWAPLSDATLDFRRQQGFGPTPINVRTGAMRAWASESDPKYFMRGTGVTMRYPGKVPRGELRKKVLTAQAGRPKGVYGAKTPARPIMGLGAPDLAAVMGLYRGWIEGFMRNPVPLGIGA